MLEIRMLILCCLLQSRYQLPLSVSSRLTGDDVMIRARVLNCVDGVNIALLQKAINEQRSFFRERESKQGEAAQAADATWSGTSLIKFPSVLRDDQSYITSSWAVCQRALCCCVSSNEQKDCLVKSVKDRFTSISLYDYFVRALIITTFLHFVSGWYLIIKAAN